MYVGVLQLSKGSIVIFPNGLDTISSYSAFLLRLMRDEVWVDIVEDVRDCCCCWCWVSTFCCWSLSDVCWVCCCCCCFSFFLFPLDEFVTSKSESDGLNLIARIIAAWIDKTRCCFLSPSNKSQYTLCSHRCFFTHTLLL